MTKHLLSNKIKGLTQVRQFEFEGPLHVKQFPSQGWHKLSDPKNQPLGQLSIQYP